MKKIVAFGELLLRLTSSGYNRFFQDNHFFASFGGAEANVAVSLSNFGLNTEFVSTLPSNEIGVAAVRELRYFGVETSYIKLKDGRMGLYFLEKGASQRSSKVIYDRAYSVFSQSQNRDYDWNVIFQDVEWFHFSGITPALSDELKNICLFACREAKKMGIVISCDLNYRAKQWSSEKAKSVMTKLMQYVDVCIANEEDADKVLGIHADDINVQTGNVLPRKYEQVAKQICDKFGCKYVAFSLRKSFSASQNGWSVMLYDRLLDVSSHSREYQIQIVDRIGSGDSFAAGIIYGIMTKMSNQEIVDFAAAASCLKHSVEGDFNRTFISEVTSLMHSSGNGRVVR